MAPRKYKGLESNTNKFWGYMGLGNSEVLAEPALKKEKERKSTKHRKRTVRAKE